MTGRVPWPVAYTVSANDCLVPVPLGFQATVAEAAQHLAELGYDGLEVQVRDAGPQDAKALLRTLRGTGLRVMAIGTGPVAGQDGLTLTDPSPDVRRHALDRLLSAARLAGALGASITLGQTRGTLLPHLEDLQRSWVEQAVRHLAEEAATCGAVLLLEPQSRTNTALWNTPDEALAAARRLTPVAGLVLDTHHLEAEGIDPLGAITEQVDSTASLQLAASGNRGPLTLGDHRLPPLLHALGDGGFTGWLTLEHTQGGNSPQAAARSWTALHDAARTLT